MTMCNKKIERYIKYRTNFCKTSKEKQIIFGNTIKVGVHYGNVDFMTLTVECKAN